MNRVVSIFYLLACILRLFATQGSKAFQGIGAGKDLIEPAQFNLHGRRDRLTDLLIDDLIGHSQSQGCFVADLLGRFGCIIALPSYGWKNKASFGIG